MIAYKKENRGTEELIYRIITNVDNLESMNKRFIRTAITL